MASWLYDARRASGMSPEDCASALHCSKNTYDSRESNPGKLDIIELGLLHKVFNKEGREIMWEALSEFKP